MVGLGGKSSVIRDEFFFFEISFILYILYIILGIHGHTGRHRRYSISIQNWYLEDVTSGGGGGGLRTNARRERYQRSE